MRDLRLGFAASALWSAAAAPRVRNVFEGDAVRYRGDFRDSDRVDELLRSASCAFLGFSPTRCAAVQSVPRSLKGAPSAEHMPNITRARRKSRTHRACCRSLCSSLRA